MEYDVTIGLEIHVQIATKTKMFCRCSADIWNKPPNSRVCPVCLGLPGALPVANEEAIEKTILAGLSLNSEINTQTYFERKHYFYPDLPKGYQISQIQKPICLGGVVELRDSTVHLDRAHLEEDAGKLFHVKDKVASYSLIDFNRSGVPLLEIVSKPEISTPTQAAEYGRKIQQLMRYSGVSEADMEKGSLRVDANISLKPKGEPKLGTKVEVKNMNSFRSVERALLFEIERQRNLLEKSQTVAQQTRGWVENQGETVLQRSKEEAHDYRYFPDPDLPLIRISNDQVEGLKKSLPELPADKIRRFVKEFGLTIDQATIVCQDKNVAIWYEEALRAYSQKDTVGISLQKVDTHYGKEIYNWVTNDLLKLLASSKQTVLDLKILPATLAEILYLRDKGVITTTAAKTVFEKVFSTELSVSQVIKDSSLQTLQDKSSLDKFADEVLAQNPEALKDYLAGKTTVMGYLIGAFRKVSRSSINPQEVENILKEKIKNSPKATS